MATYTEAKIAAALLTRLDDLTLTPPLQIAWPNIGFDPPADTYLRVDDMRNVTDRVVIADDGPHRQQGILQVMVMAPLDDGEIGALDIAGQIADWFMAEPRLFFTGGSVRITKRPDVASFKSPDGRRWQVPVSVTWEAYI